MALPNLFHDSSLIAVFTIHHCLNLDRKTEECDKTCTVFLVVIAFAEGRYLLGVQGVGAPDTGVDHIALVELQLDGAGNHLLGFIHEGGEGFPQGGEPLAVVDQHDFFNLVLVHVNYLQGMNIIH